MIEYQQIIDAFYDDSCFETQLSSEVLENSSFNNVSAMVFIKGPNFGNTMQKIHWSFSVSWNRFVIDFCNANHIIDIIDGDSCDFSHFPQCNIKNKEFRDALLYFLRKFITEKDVIDVAIENFDPTYGIYYHSEQQKNAIKTFSYVHDYWFQDDLYLKYESVPVSHIQYLRGKASLNNEKPLSNMKILWWCNNFCKEPVYFISSNWAAFTNPDDLVRFKLIFN